MQIFEVTEGILKGIANPTPSYKPAASAGFAKNAAEYFAKSILDKAGISPEMQGNYDPTGHVAASQRRGTASINKQEIELARQLSREYQSQKTLNNKSFIGKPTEKDFQDAVVLANKRSGNEQNVDVAKVSAQLQKLMAEPAAQSIALTRQAKQAAAAKAAQDQMAPFSKVEPAPAVWTNPRTGVISRSPITKPAVQPATAAPVARTRTGGKVAGQLSQTPSAIRKRQARAAAAADKKSSAQAFGSMAQQLRQPTAKRPAVAPVKQPKPATAIKGAQPGAPTAAEYEKLEKRLQQALQRKQTA